MCRLCICYQGLNWYVLCGGALWEVVAIVFVDLGGGGGGEIGDRICLWGMVGLCLSTRG